VPAYLHGAASQRRAKQRKRQEMIMKYLMATALVALGLLSTAITVQAASDLPDYPEWAQRAFENKG
jgi:hypothetical protein